MATFMQNCVQRYNIIPKTNQTDKNRFFLAFGDIPLNDITVEEIYQAIDVPEIKLVYAKHAVRKANSNIWGNSYVISISKKNYFKDKFFQINALEEQKQLLSAEKEMLINEIEELKFHIYANTYNY